MNKTSGFQTHWPVLTLTNTIIFHAYKSIIIRLSIDSAQQSISHHALYLNKQPHTLTDVLSTTGAPYQKTVKYDIYYLALD